MKRFLLDTNAVLRFLRNDIPKQADQVAKLFTDAKHGEVLVTVPMVVFLESVFVLSSVYKEPKHDVGKQLFDLAMNPLLDIENREMIKQALLIWKNHNVSFVDCLLLAQAKEEKKLLFTFDEQLKRIATV